MIYAYGQVRPDGPLPDRLAGGVNGVIRDAMADMVKKGNAMLSEMRRSGIAGELGTMKACPICSGAEGACQDE